MTKAADDEPKAEVEAAWALEIERRARDAHANPEDDVAWETVRAELHASPTSPDCAVFYRRGRL
jgi:hypothetical protein